jgi:hypothetical protein
MILLAKATTIASGVWAAGSHRRRQRATLHGLLNNAVRFVPIDQCSYGISERGRFAVPLMLRADWLYDAPCRQVAIVGRGMGPRGAEA